MSNTGGFMKFTNEYRVLDLYHRLCEGRIINKQEEACRYSISSRSLQRDISTIRCFLADRSIFDGNESRDIIYKKEKGGYIMVEICEYINDNNIFIVIYMFTKKAYLI